MPTQTKKNEHKWQKAQELAEEAGKGENYAYIMGIYKRMDPDYEFKTAARVIKIPKSRLKVVAQELVKTLIKKIPSTDKTIGRKIWAQLPFSLTAANGGHKLVYILIRSIPLRSKGTYIQGGAVGKHSKTGDDILIIELNGSFTGVELQASMTYPKILEDQIYAVLIHEITHLADPVLIPSVAPNTTEIPTGGDVNFDVYYNNKSEVRAYLQEIVNELEGKFLQYEKTKKMMGDKAFGVLMNRSLTWRTIQKHLNPQNRKYIQKAIWTSLQDWATSKTATLVGTDTAAIYAIAPEQLKNLILHGAWFKLQDNEFYEQADELIRGYGGAIWHTNGDGMFVVDVPEAVDGAGAKAPYYGLREFAKQAALVGTDTATIYAVAPEQLKHIIDEQKWDEAAEDVWGDKKTVDLEGSLEKMDKLVRQHGGAVFHTKADGTWDVKIKGVEGKGYLPPYRTSKKAKKQKIVKKYKITFRGDAKDLFDRFLALPHYNKKFSGIYAMPFDGDGADSIQVSSPKLKSSKGIYEIAAGGDVELATIDGYKCIHTGGWYEDTIIEEYEISFNSQELLDTFEKFLGFLHFNGGHSGNFGFQVENTDKLKVLSPKLPKYDIPEAKDGKVILPWGGTSYKVWRPTKTSPYYTYSDETSRLYIHFKDNDWLPLVWDSYRRIKKDEEATTRERMEYIQRNREQMDLETTKTAGWWAFEPGNPKYPLSGNANPTEEDMLKGYFLGDGPADLMGDALSNVDLDYRLSWGRPAKLEEIEELIRFVMGPSRDDKIMNENEWIDELSGLIEIPLKELYTLDSNTLKELRSLSRSRHGMKDSTYIQKALNIIKKDI